MDEVVTQERVINDEKRTEERHKIQEVCDACRTDVEKHCKAHNLKYFVMVMSKYGDYISATNASSSELRSLAEGAHERME